LLLVCGAGDWGEDFSRKKKRLGRKMRMDYFNYRL